MEPCASTRRAFEELGGFDGRTGPDLPRGLCDAAEKVRHLVPSCVAVSLGLVSSGVTFTVQTADAGTQDDAIARFGTQQPPSQGRGQDMSGAELLSVEGVGACDERWWAAGASTSAAHGIAATLTLPIVDHAVGSKVTGVVDLYACVPGAFDGLHGQVAAIFDAWAPGAVTNADLSFETRRWAQRAPTMLREAAVVNQAIGMLMACHRLDAVTARALLDDAAARARTSVAAVALDVVGILSRNPSRRRS